MWRIREAIKVFAFRLRHPVVVHVPTWGCFDHSHTCIASMILDEKSFKEVCPAGGRCNIGLDDVCDTCGYLLIIQYGVNKHGKKYIDIV